MKKLFLFIGTACLLATGCKKKEEEQQPAPTADFSHSVNDMTVTFTDASSGEVGSYLWDFGDGNSSQKSSPEHTYDEAGDYTVQLTVSNDGGSDSKTATVTVESTTSGEEATSSNPTFGDMDAGLYAINTHSYQNVGGFPVETKLGSAVGVFLDGSGNYVTAGNVEADGHSLSQNPNNTYVWTATDGTTHFSGNVPWSVSGDNGFSSFSETVTLGFPTVSEISSSTTVNTSSAYTLSTSSSISGADSVLFHVSGPDGNTVTATLAGNQNSHTFSSSDLSGLGSGNGIAQVAAYTFISNTYSGKKVYFVNESVVSINVTIQ